jgi:hypothetical protein
LDKAEVTPVISKIVRGKLTWQDLTKKYPLVQVDDGEGGNAPAADAVVAKEATVIETTARGSFRRPAPED